MVGEAKNKFSDFFKRDDEKEETKKTTLPKSVKKAPPKKVKRTAKRTTQRVWGGLVRSPLRVYMTRLRLPREK